jgi:DNA-binding transcriptional MocR family regulator
MTIWTPDLSDRTGPRYEAIADAIAEAITADKLSSGEKLPPQRDLAWRLGVTVGTISRAYRLAHDRGLVTGEVGRGTYVAAPTDIGDEVVPTPAENFVNLARNYYPPSPRLADAFSDALQTLAIRPGRERLLSYLPSSGHIDHRRAGAKWVARVGLKADPDNIVLLGGTQQGLSATLRALAQPGDTVLSENLSYMGLEMAATNSGLKIAGVELDEEGMCPQSLRRMAEETGARLVFTVPTLHNPTAAVMSVERRQAIIDVAREKNLFIVEDDVYGYLIEDRPPTIASMAPDITVYLSGLSKSVSSGLRVAWAVAPRDICEKITSAVFSLTVAQPGINPEIAKMWIDNGTADDVVRWQRKEVAARYALAQEVFEGLEFMGHPSAYHIFLSLPSPWRTQEFVEAARARGYGIVPADTFAVDRTPTPHAVRISLCDPRNHDTLRQALIVIRDLATSGRQPQAHVI